MLTPISQITEDEVIVVADVKFFDELEAVLKRTSKKTLANYVMWRVAADSTIFLTEQLKKRKLEYKSVLTGQKIEISRWRECFMHMIFYLQVATSSLYVRNYFDQDSKKSVHDMVNVIKKEFEDTLKKVSWMDETTRAVALAKIKKMNAHLGYPDELLDDKKIILFHKNVEIDEHKFLESALNLEIFDVNITFNKYREIVSSFLTYLCNVRKINYFFNQVNRSDWEWLVYSTMVNAFYDSLGNYICKYSSIEKKN